MYFRYIFALWLLLLSSAIHATENPIIKKDNPYFKYLLEHGSNQHNLIDYNNTLKLNDEWKNSVSYIITNNSLLIKPKGTGKLFQIKKSTKPNSNELLVLRIDSTYYTGYNFLDYVILKNDTIFSIGGEGFWNHNGQVRYYAKEKGEWELIPIQYWFPISEDDIVDIRKKSGNIYTFFQINKLNNAFTSQKNNNIDTALVLNINTGNIITLGPISSNIKSITKSNIIKIETDYGLMILSNGTIKLLDFEQNKYLEWNNIKLNNLFNSTKAELKPIIIKDSTLLYFNLDKLDSIVLPISQFKYISDIYVPIASTTNSYNSKILISGFIILCFIFFFIVIKIKAKKRKDNIKQTNIHKESEGTIDGITELKNVNIKDLFEENELQLLSQILENNNKISVDQLNYILGLDKKSIQVQKKNRSSIISSINIKFKTELNTNEDLIQRIKNEDDARNILYQINEIFIEAIKSYL